MGKLTAYILGITVAIVLSYYVLSLDYSALINWLGPVTGVTIIFPFAFLYLLMGSILSYPMLLLVWIIIGAVVGIGARKGTRAIGAAIAVYFSLWGFMIGSLLVFAQAISGTSLTNSPIPGLGTSSGFQIPPLPPGVTMTAILSEPLVQPLVTMISTMGGILPLGSLTGTTTATTTPTISSVSSIVMGTFLPYLIVNIVVFFVTAAVVGWLIHRLLHKQKGKPDTAAVEVENRKPKYRKVKYRKVTRQSPVPVVGPLLAIVVVSLVLLSSSTAFISPGVDSTGSQVTGTASSSPGYSAVNVTLASADFIGASAVSNANTTGTNLTNVTAFSYGGGMVGTYGNIYNLYAFFNSSVAQGSGFFSTGAAGESIMTLLLISENIPALFKALEQDGIISDSFVNSLQDNQYYNLIPGAILLQLFFGNVSETSSIAGEAAGNISSTMGAGSLNNFLTVSLPVSSQSSQVQYMSLYAYSFSAAVQSSESQLVQAASHYMSTDGMYSVFSHGITSGYLIPGYNSGSVDSSIFIAGKIDTTNLPSNLLSNTTLVPNFGNGNGTGVMAFVGGLFVKESVIHSSATTHQLTASQIFGYSGKAFFNNTDTAYVASLTYPIMGSNSTVTQYNSTVYTTVGNVSVPGTSGNVTFIYMPYGSFIDFSSVNFTTNAVFPANIIVTQAISAESGNVYNVTVTLKNNDTDTMNNVRVTAGQVLSKYGSNAELVSGSTGAVTATLLPGHSVSLHYGVRLSGVGTYIVANPVFNYTISNTSFSVLGNSVIANAKAPSVIYAVHQSQLSTFSTISSLLHVPLLIQQIFPGFYFFDLVFVLIILLAVFLEYRALERWRKNRNQEQKP